MTQPDEAGDAPYWERPRVGGRFSRTAGQPPRPSKQITDLHKLRNVAMRLSGNLQQMMPPLKEMPGYEEKPVSPALKQLLGPHGVISSFDTLVAIICKLLDKEGETHGKSPAVHAFDEDDERALEARILEDLDRIAVRKRQAGGTDPQPE